MLAKLTASKPVIGLRPPLLAAVIVFALALPAFAVLQARDGHDYAISKAEAAGNADIVKDFDHADRNRDGKLSRAEYASVGQPRPAIKKQKQAAR